MTLEIISYNTIYPISVNTPNADVTGTYELVVTSQLSNLPIFTVPLTLVLTNSRYSEFTFVLPQLEGDKHLNSMCNYTIYFNTGTWNSGSLKLVYSPGGGTGTKDYISDNEKRESIVYYTPDY
jgi:hypothetical protein